MRITSNNWLKDIKDVEEDTKKISSDSLDTVVWGEIVWKAKKLGLIQDKESQSQAAQRGQKFSDTVKQLDAKAKGLVFFVFFLGGIALVAAYFTIIFSIVHILCH
jgi:hypothetical protein